MAKKGFVKVIKDDQKRIQKIQNELRKLYGAKLKIGVMGEDDKDMVMIASVHEFGVRIEVTDKMRGWFMGQGYFISPDTKYINIPERSYLRRAFDENLSDIRSDGNELLTKVVRGEATANQFMNKMGVMLVSIVRQTIDDVDKPPLSDMTKEMRTGQGGGESPLQDTGRLWQAISYEVEW